MLVIVVTRCGFHSSALLCVQEEFSHPVESLALTVDEVINVRRVLVKAEMEKFLQSKELYNNLKKGKVMNLSHGCFSVWHVYSKWS